MVDHRLVKMNTFPDGLPVVVCDECGQAHLRIAKTYIAIAGNIYVGDQGGLVGNALNDEGRVARMYVLCRKKCAKEFLEKAVLEHCYD